MKLKLVFLSIVVVGVIGVGVIGSAVYFSTNKNNSVHKANESPIGRRSHGEEESRVNGEGMEDGHETDEGFLDGDYMIPSSRLKIDHDQVKRIDDKKGIFRFNDKEFSVVKEGEDYYLESNEENDIEFANPTLELPLMFDESIREKQSENSKWYPSFEDGYYYIYFMDIGYVRIDDGKIWGGFVKSNETIVVNERLIDAGLANGVELGSIDEGINMLKLQSLKAYTDNSLFTAQSNLPTETSFRFFKMLQDGKEYVALAMNKAANYPNDLGIVPSKDVDELYDENSIGDNWWIDDRKNDDERTLWALQVNDLDYYLGGFTNKDGEEYKVTIEKNSNLDKTINVNLNDLYYPIKYHTEPTSLDVLGNIFFNARHKLELPEGIMVDTDEPIDVRLIRSRYMARMLKWRVKLTKYFDEKEDLLEESKEKFCDSSVFPYYRQMANMRRYKYASPRMEDIYEEWEKFRDQHKTSLFSFKDAIDLFKKFKPLEGRLDVSNQVLKTICGQ